MEFWTPDGQLAHAPAEEVATKIAEGWRPTRDAVATIYPDGEARWTPPGEIDTALAAGGRIVSDHELAAHQRAEKIRKEAEDSPIRAAVEGFARGFTIGASDFATRGLGGLEAGAEAEARAQAHPWLSTAAEILGALALTGVTLGAGAGAAGAGTAARLGTGAARVAAIPGRATAALGARTTAALGGGQTARVAGLAVEAAAQSALAEGGRAALTAQDADEVAGRMLAGAGFGAAAGAGLGVLGGIAGAAWKKATPQVLDFAEKRAAKAIGVRQTDITRISAKKGLDAADARIRRAVTEVRARGLLAAGDDITTTAKKISDAREALGAEIGEMQRSIAPAIAAADEEVAREVTRSLRASSVMAAVRDELQPLLRSQLATDRARARKALRELASLERPRWRVDRTGARARVVADTDPVLGIDELIETRKRLDALIYPKPASGGMPPPPPPHVDGLVAARRAIEKRIEEVTERVFSPEQLTAYRDAKRSFEALSDAAQISTRAAGADLGNRWISPTDYLAGGGGVLTGLLAAAPAVLAGDLGALVLGPIGGAVGALMHRQLRRRLSSALDTWLPRATAPGAAEAFGARVRAAAIQTTVAARREKRDAKEALRVARRLTTAADAQRPAAIAQALAPTAPPLDCALHERQAKVTDPAELRAWQRRVEVAENPDRALDLLLAGQLTREHVETLAAVHPEALRDLREEVVAELAEREERGERIPLAMTAQLSVLLGAPVAQLVTRGALRRTAAQYARVHQQPPAPAASLRAAEKAGAAIAQASTLGSDAAVGPPPE